MQIKESEAVIGITGETGTLTELVASIYDYKLPTAFYQGSSAAVDKFRPIDNYFAEQLRYEKNIQELLDYLEST